VIYLLTLVLKMRNYSYTNRICNEELTIRNSVIMTKW